MSVTLHLSDTHFGTERRPVVEALLALAREQAVDRAILSGDITQRARSREFRAARAFVDRLGVPVLAIPGNHDLPLFNPLARVLHPYRRFAQTLGGRTTAEFDTPELLAIGVNTTRWWRHTDGVVDEAQIEHVAARLRRASPAQLRLVVTHQPVHVTRERDQHNRLHRAEAAIAAWSAAGADLVLGGHIHLPYFRSLRAQDLTLPRELWAVQAGTATSRRVRFEAPNSVNLIRRGADRPAHCTLERWDYSARSRCFERGDCLLAALDR